MQRIALITGGTRGIGLGIARRLVAENVGVMLTGRRSAEEVAATVSELRESGGTAEYLQADVADTAAHARVLEHIRERFNRLDVLVNNAGITSPGRKDLLEANPADFSHVLATNLVGPFFLTQQAARWMIEQQAGEVTAATDGLASRRCIINITSISAEFPSVNRGDYCLSKAALQMATRLWAARLAPHGIDVFEVQPGVIRSDMTAAVTAKYDRLLSEGLTLQRRWGEPDDIGRAVAMLVRGDLPYATGQVLKIDGGMTIRPL